MQLTSLKMKRLIVFVLVLILMSACLPFNRQNNVPQAEPTAVPDSTEPEEADNGSEDTNETDPSSETDEPAQPTAIPTTEASSSTGVMDDGEFVFGMILVGPKNDNGWSQGHYEAGLYVEENVPNSRMIVLDDLNPGVRPDMTVPQVVDDMVSQGADMIFVTSEDMAADTEAAAVVHPDTVFIHASGDHALRGDGPPNLGNYFGRMTYGKMIAGCAAALATQSGEIGYLGPLINSEMLRLASAQYLGARYCWEHYRDRDPSELEFKVEWIGFWFHIPGVTEDPLELAQKMFDEGLDAVGSGLDTTEALMVANERMATGEVAYGFTFHDGGCNAAPNACLGSPYFNWRPGYLELVQQVIDGTWEAEWEWPAPNWEAINDLETSPIGFARGEGLTSEQEEILDEFTAGLASGELVLFKGPLNYQDGTTFLEEGEVATTEQLWYLPQLLEGMEGASE